MKAFLLETLWIGYALYFRPAELERRLSAQIEGTHPTQNPVNLISIAHRLGQPAARRYLGQLTLLCAIAALPFLWLAPGATAPPSLPALLATYLLLLIIGFGAAVVEGAAGPICALTFGLLLGAAAEPAAWVQTLLSDEVTNLLREEIRQGLLIGLPVALLIGTAGGGLARWRGWVSEPGNVVKVVGLGRRVKVIGLDNGTNVIPELGVAFYAVSGIAGGVVLGVVFGVAIGVVGGVADFEVSFVSFGVWGGLSYGVMMTMHGLVARIVALLVKFSIFLIAFLNVASVIMFAMMFIVVDMPGLPLIVLLSAGFLLGLLPGAFRWRRGELIIWLALLLFFFFALWPSMPLMFGWLLSTTAGVLRLPFFLLYATGAVWQQWRPQFGDKPPATLFTPWRWDELIPFPLPYLDQQLVAVARRERQQGLTLIEEAAATWRQGGMAQRALLFLTADTLAAYRSEAALAQAHRELDWLPETLPQTAQDTVGRFRAISRAIAGKIALTDANEQEIELARAKDQLQKLKQGLTFVPQRERELFAPVVEQWLAILRRATTRLPNPYVAGDPLRGGGLFVGREDIVRQLQSHLAQRSQQPTLFLFGQRRMGKSSLLYQLPEKFDANTIPIRLDCQAAEMVESNATFLFNLARAIVRQAQETRQLELPAPPALSDISFTAFSLWLEAVEAMLGRRVLLLSFDEFESLGEAVNKGYLDERVLGFLRNLIQHHSQVTLLLAGSHRPAEIGRPWSDYLISATVLPISYLRPEDVERLVTQPIPGFPLQYAPEAVAYIIELTRCQPLLVQLLCQQLVLLLNERGERYAAKEDVETAVAPALEMGGSLYFTYLAEYDAQDAGQAILRQLAQRGPGAVIPVHDLTGGDPEREKAIERLLARDLIEREGEGVRFQVELTRRWWARPQR
jgi:hypothetical protein